MPFSAASFFASGLAPTLPPVAGIGVGIETGVGIGAATETNVVNVPIMLIYNIFQFSVAIGIICLFKSPEVTVSCLGPAYDRAPMGFKLFALLRGE